MKKAKKSLILMSIMTLTLLLFTNIMFVQADDSTPQIYYAGVQNDGAGSYTFTYAVKSTSPNITKWQLHGEFFEKTDFSVHVIAKDDIAGSQIFEALYITNPGLGNIEFNHESDHKFTEGVMRINNITINTNDYTGISTDEIEYQIYWPPESTLTGSIIGPVDPADLIEPPAWYMNIPPITIPVIFVAVLLVAYWRKWL